MNIIEKLLLNFFIIALLSVSNSFCTAAGAAEQLITLRDGFNFAAVTVTPDSGTQAIMAANPSIKEIYLYSSSAGSFLSAASGDFSSLAPGRGYIIRSEGAASLRLQGSGAPQAGDIKLKAGFNLSGFSINVTPVKFSELMSAYPQIKGIYKWSAASGGFIQVLRVNDRPAAIDGADPEIIAGQSYFINMAADAVLNYDSGAVKITGDVTEPEKPAEPVSPLSLALSISEDSVEQNGVYDLSQIKAVVKYSDGSAREVSASYTCDSGVITVNLYQAPASPGTASIKVSYTEGAITLDCILKFNIIEKPIDIADYFPLRREDFYYYSNGLDVIDYRITGEYYAAGVLATKFSSSSGTYDYYRLDETGLYLCDTFSDKPNKLSDKNPKLNESCVSYVKNSLGQAVYTSTLLSRDAYSVHGGLFDDVLVIENKMTVNGVTSSMYFFFARGVGLIRYATSLMQFEFTGGQIGGSSYAPAKKKWTFLIYSCGDTDRNDISPTLINEIKGYRNTDIEKDANIVVQLSPSSAYYLNPYNNEFRDITASRYYLKDGVFYRVFSRIDQHTNNGDKKEFSRFLNWGAAAFPAERYAVIISAHGSGIISVLGGSAAPKRSIAYDDHPYDFLSAIEYKSAFAELKSKIGKNIDIIAFDSCIMGMLEVAYQLKDCADYFVASEAVALERDTALFSNKFSALADKNPLAVAKALVDSYVDSTKIAGQSVTMSVVDLSKVSYAASCMNAIASPWLSQTMNSSEAAAFVNAIYKSQRFGPAPYNESAATLLYDFSTSYIDLFDLAGMISLNAGAGNLKNQADALLAFKNQLIAYNRAIGIYYPRAAGLTIFVPKFSTQWYNSDMTGNYIREQYLYYNDFGAYTLWGVFLDDWAAFLYRNGW
jgi:hypothetical protein